MSHTHPRRTCPACARRYAGLIEPDCPVCTGTGVLGLGAAALATIPPGAVARAVELYLEVSARTAVTRLPYADRRDALEGAVLELRLTGILTTIADTGTPAHAGATEPTRRELDRTAHDLTRRLRRPATPEDTRRLEAAPAELEDARPAGAVLATASANGHRARLAVVADPIDPLGPNLLDLEAERMALEHAARVTAQAADQLAHRPQRTAAR